MAHKIAILMSTYNGEKYLRDQIQSILGQTNHDWHLYIRDDGSKDKTQQIIREYADKYDNITFFNDGHVKNLGVVKSFMDLLAHVDADFYMFSDQDDYWKSFKVQHTLDKMLQQQYQSVPVCVHTSLKPVDESLKNAVESQPKRVWTSFQKVLFCNCVTGCTAMINQQLKVMLNFDDINYHRLYMHDWWFALIASAFGQLAYVDEETLLYRQHSDNVEGSLRRNTVGWVLYRITHYDYDRKDMRKVIQMSNEFYREYGNQLSGKNRAYVKEYGNLINDSSFLHNLWLVLKLPPQERTVRGMLFFAYLMLLFPNDFLKL